MRAYLHALNKILTVSDTEYSDTVRVGAASITLTRKRKSFKCYIPAALTITYSFQSLIVYSELHEYRSGNNGNKSYWSSNNTVPIMQLAAKWPVVADVYETRPVLYKHSTVSTPYESSMCVYKPQATPT